MNRQSDKLYHAPEELTPSEASEIGRLEVEQMIQTTSEVCQAVQGSEKMPEEVRLAIEAEEQSQRDREYAFQVHREVNSIPHEEEKKEISQSTEVAPQIQYLRPSTPQQALRPTGGGRAFMAIDTSQSSLAKREQWAVELRKKRKIEVLGQKRAQLQFNQAFNRTWPRGIRPSPGCFFRFDAVPVKLLNDLIMHAKPFTVFFDKRDSITTLLVAEIEKESLPQICGWVRKDYVKNRNSAYVVRRDLEYQYLDEVFIELLDLWTKYKSVRVPDHCYQVETQVLQNCINRLGEALYPEGDADEPHDKDAQPIPAKDPRPQKKHAGNEAKNEEEEDFQISIHCPEQTIRCTSVEDMRRQLKDLEIKSKPQPAAEEAPKTAKQTKSTNSGTQINPPSPDVVKVPQKVQDQQQSRFLNNPRERHSSRPQRNARSQLPTGMKDKGGRPPKEKVTPDLIALTQVKCDEQDKLRQKKSAKYN